MEFSTQPAGQAGYAVAHASVDERSAFIVKTYLHLAGAITAFMVLEVALFASGIAEQVIPLMLGGKYSWLVVLGLFMGVGYVADMWARSSKSLVMQYAGLGLYVVAQALIFMPLLAMAMAIGMDETGNPMQIITKAAAVTIVLFGGLTAVVFLTRKDFSFLRSTLMFGGFAAMALIVASIVLGFDLGLLFSWGMVVLVAGYILYNTSNVLHHYRTDQYVSAALALFADIAILFWYILRIFMSRD